MVVSVIGKPVMNEDLHSRLIERRFGHVKAKADIDLRDCMDGVSYNTEPTCWVEVVELPEHIREEQGVEEQFYLVYRPIGGHPRVIAYMGSMLGDLVGDIERICGHVTAGLDVWLEEHRRHPNISLMRGHVRSKADQFEDEVHEFVIDSVTVD